MAKLEPYNPVTQDEWVLAKRDLAQIQDFAARLQKHRVKARDVKRQWAGLYSALEACASSYDASADDLIDGVSPNLPQLDDILVELAKESETIIWLWDNRRKLAAAIRKVQDARLYQFLLKNVGQRAQDDVSRQFFRALSELRRQQDWRLRRNVGMVQDVQAHALPTSLAESVADSTNQTNSH